MALAQHSSAIKYIPAVLLLSALAAWYFTRTVPLQIKLVSVTRGTVEATVNNTRAGTVKACHRAKLSAPSGGQIAQLLVKKGDRVKTGQLLLKLWDKDLQAQLALAQEQLITAQTQAVQSCLQDELADREFKRAAQLQLKGFISSEGLDQKSSSAQVLHAGCNAAKSRIEEAKSHITAAKTGLDRLLLRAPFDGIIAEISGELGEYATPSPPGIPTPPAIDLIDDHCLFVSAPIDEVDAAGIKSGQLARISLDAIKGKSFAGRVKRLAPYVLEIEKQARTVEVEVDFIAPPTDENLLTGYSADVEIVHARHLKVLRIPTQSLLEGHKVLLYKADGMLTARAVTTGLANWDETEITAGLSEGDQIVLNTDQSGIKAGIRVQPEEK